VRTLIRIGYFALCSIVLYFSATVVKMQHMVNV